VLPSSDQQPGSGRDVIGGSGDGAVFCVGLATLDIIFNVTELPKEAIKVFASSRRESGGGPAANAAICVSRLGGRASFAGRLGADSVGDHLEAEFRVAGVDTTWLKRFAGVASPSSAVLVDARGERLIAAYSDPAMPTTSEWLQPDLQGGVALADLSWPQGALAVFETASRAGLPRILDADRFRHDPALVWPVIDLASHVIFSRPGLAQLTGIDDIQAGLALVTRPGHAMTGVTDGSAGVFWLKDGVLLQQAPPQINVVDTTGAGDAFHGAFAYAIARGDPLEQAIGVATVVAALKCSSKGSRSGLPTMQDVAKFVEAAPLPKLMQISD
jgi:sulfofructose kinase